MAEQVRIYCRRRLRRPANSSIALCVCAQSVRARLCKRFATAASAATAFASLEWRPHSWRRRRGDKCAHIFRLNNISCAHAHLSFGNITSAERPTTAFAVRKRRDSALVHITSSMHACDHRRRCCQTRPGQACIYICTMERTRTHQVYLWHAFAN